MQPQIAHGLNQTYRMILLCQLRFLQLQFKGLAQHKFYSIEVRSALDIRARTGMWTRVGEALKGGNTGELSQLTNGTERKVRLLDN